ncbi:MAG: type II toxin-antitoxin system RelE/ParE family toxin [Pseudomonadota bacterium]|uniref:type II toxin-antitoxin system RelE/ParE family toxin n=1 Tax=Sphingomonas sp. ERG5 TaxID=1381597 RepID=UPI00054C2856|nr:type II toxin-antitoxin system RelE/ParE family toxin [Sphingomonas sp. ERG5]
MIRLELSEAAQADLATILDHGVAMFGEDMAEAHLLEFEDVLDLIRTHPLAGSAHSVVRPPTRGLPSGSHRIFYDVFVDRVVVQPVLHQSMDVERWL